MIRDKECPHCEEPVDDPDTAEPVACLTATGVELRVSHPECAMRAIIGGLNHLLGRCSCCGGSEPPDPPEMTRREAAQAAVAYWQTGRRP